MTAQHAALVLTNVQLKQSPKVIFIKLMPISALIVDHVLMYALLKLFTPHKDQFLRTK